MGKHRPEIIRPLMRDCLHLSSRDMENAIDTVVHRMKVKRNKEHGDDKKSGGVMMMFAGAELGRNIRTLTQDVGERPFLSAFRAWGEAASLSVLLTIDNQYANNHV